MANGGTRAGQGLLLDQVSSQRLARIAGETGALATPGPAATAVSAPDRTGARRRALALALLFLGLSLFALAGMVLQVISFGLDGWEAEDVIQLALMVILLTAVVSQSRGLLRTTAWGRKLLAFPGRLRPGAQGDTQAVGATPCNLLLDAVSAEDLLVADSAERAIRRPKLIRAGVAKRRAQVALLLAALVFSCAGFALGLVLLGYTLVYGDITDPAVILSLPFTFLGGYAVFQFVRGARRTGFRGRTWFLASRSFRDSVHLWSSGNVVIRLALTGTAAASVAGAGLTPFVVKQDVRQDLIVYDSAAAALYRIDINSGSNLVLDAKVFDAAIISMTTTTQPVAGPQGRRAPRGSMIALVSPARGRQVLVAQPASDAKVVALAPLKQPLDGPLLAVGPSSGLVAIDRAGVLWGVDAATGDITQLATTGLRPTAMAYVREASAFLVISGDRATYVDASGRLLDITMPGIAGMDVCSVFTAPGYRAVGDRKSGKIFVINAKSGANEGMLQVDNHLAFQQPCAMTLAPPKKAAAATSTPAAVR